MDIAAERRNKDIRIYVEGDWREILRYFGREKADIELATFIKGNNLISCEYDGEVSSYDEELKFCTGFNFTIAEFNRKSKKADLSTLLEIHLQNKFFEIEGSFNDTFSITFWNYAKNPVFKNWLKRAMTIRQAEKLLEQLKKKKTYFSKGFAEFQAEHDKEYDFANLILNRIRVRSEREQDLKKRLSTESFNKFSKRN